MVKRIHFEYSKRWRELATIRDCNAYFRLRDLDDMVWDLLDGCQEYGYMETDVYRRACKLDRYMDGLWDKEFWPLDYKNNKSSVWVVLPRPHDWKWPPDE